MLTPKLVDAKFNPNTFGYDLKADNFVVLENLDTSPPTAPANLTATGTNGKTTNLSWTASTDDVGVTGYDIYNGDKLLGSVDATITSYWIRGLTEFTTYSFTIKAKDGAGNFSISSNEVSITTLDGTPPTRPTDLAASEITGTSVTLSWAPSTDNVGVTSYNVYQSSNLLATVNTTTYTYKGLKQGITSRFSIKALDSDGNVSFSSLDILVKPLDIVPPTAATDLRSSAATATTVNLTWTASTDSEGVTSYDIYKGGNLLVGSSTTTSFTVAGLVANNSYLFSVKARDAAGNASDVSRAILVKTLDTMPPTAPTNLIASDITSTTTTLSWTASTDNEGVTLYHIYNGDYKIGTSTTTSITFDRLLANTSYSFIIKAEDAAGNISSVGSNTVSITTTPAYCVSAGYSEVLMMYMTRVKIGTIDKRSGQANNSYGDYTNISTDLKKGEVYSISINPYMLTNTTWHFGKRYAVWIDYNGDKDFFDEGELIWNHIVTDEPLVTGTFTVPNSVITGDTRMRVTIIDSGVGIPPPCGDYSGTYNYGETEDYTVNIVDNIIDPQGPTIPTNLTATGTTWTTTNLSWKAPTGTTGDISYEIYKENVLIGTSETVNYTVTGLNQATIYLFTVKAKNANGNISSSSIPVLVTTVKDQQPSTPTNLMASGTTATKTNLSWTASTNNTGNLVYYVYASDILQSNSLVAQVSTPNCIVKNLMTNQNYTFTVKAVDSEGNNSTMSKSISVTTLKGSTDITPPTAPTNLIVSNVTTTSVVLNWNPATDNEKINGYDIYSGSNKININSVNSYVNTYTITGLTDGTNYSFYVKALDVGGNSTSSNAVSVTTLLVPKYCSTSTTGGNTDDIYRVQLNSIDNSATSLKEVANYNDFSSISTNLTPGQENPLSIQLIKKNANDSIGIAIWIDLNNDKDFNDSGELVWSKMDSSPSFTSISGNFTIPITAATGKTRMRVSIKRNAIPTACETFQYGVIEDYSVNIQKPIVEYEAPTAPTGITVSDTTSSTTNLSWTASTDNIAVTAYDIYKDNILVGTSSITSYMATGLLATTTYLFTVKAKDYAGNISTASDAVSVTTLPNTPAIIITAPNTITTNTNLGCIATGVVLGIPVTTGNVVAVTNNAPSTYPLGNTTVTWTVKDVSNNIATATQIITVKDVTKPTITAPPTVIVNANSNGTATGVKLGTPVTADNCSVASVTNDAPSTFPLGNTVVTWTVKDASNNIATATQIVTVKDATPPTLIPVAIFTASTTAANTNESINFKDNSINTPTSWAWEITKTGSATLTSSLQNPTFNFVYPGTYTVKLTATNGAGSNTITVTNMITIFISLPSNNFTIESKGETCLNQNNGEINIVAKASYNYVATINGTKYPLINNSLKVANLAPATYNVSIGITGELFEQNYTVTIPKGATITAKSTIDSRLASVEISEGTAPYTVFVNGEEQFETASDTFSVSVNKGDFLEVKTAKACEGIYLKEIDTDLLESVLAHPNPTNGKFEIEVPISIKKVIIDLYTIDSKIISKKTYTPTNGRVPFNIENQASGVYIAKIYLSQPKYLKIIKK